MRLSSLDRKLVRDLAGMRGQAIAIGLVLAAGIAMYVADLSTFDSLRRTQSAYCDRYRIAPARVRRIEPSGFMKVSALGVEEQRVNVVMDFDEPGGAEPALGDGYRVEVRIIIWEGDAVLKVPVSSLLRRGADWAVFVAEGGRASLRAVRLGRRNTTAAEVRDGLREGEAVVVHPGDALQDRSRIARRASWRRGPVLRFGFHS